MSNKLKISEHKGLSLTLNIEFPYVHIYDATVEQLHHNWAVKKMYDTLKMVQRNCKLEENHQPDHLTWIDEVDKAIEMMDVDDDKYENLI